MKKIFSGAVTMIFCAACSSGEKQPEVPPPVVAPAPSASIEAKQVAAQSGSSYVAEFAFPAKSAKLNAAGKKKLAQLMKDAGSEKIASAKVIAWSDREYPSEAKEDLPQADADLAEARGGAVSDWLESKKIEDIEIVNMAKRPGTFAGVLQSGDQRIKKALEISGKGSAKRGHVIVILLTENP